MKRCIAYCTAENYHLDSLRHIFKSQDCKLGNLRNVLHICYTEAELFFFPHGCFVAWGLSYAQEQSILSQLSQFSIHELKKKEFHKFSYQSGEKTSLVADARLNADIITIDSEATEDVLLKLAISYGLSQSVKLRVREIVMQKIVGENQPIAQELAQRGRISLSRNAISKRIGEIFLTKSLVNLSNEYLDVSEYFWRYPHLEPYYLMAEKFLDIQKRVSSLNQRLDVVHDIALMLSNQLEHRYSSILEIIIIVLIFGEIILNVTSYFLKG